MNSLTQAMESWFNQNRLHGILSASPFPADHNLEFDPNREPEQYAEYLELLPAQG
ncbi:MAG TPA: hypothetical protein VFO10_07850 [Oligoflexus sp.]|uniref:hypothetical protein n=1 Tax=Oligoflexus sp. TaxID=1971216 RepID=UPI002D7EADA4|nr:hypothetical protein [Oligoflexus sp.]HET9237148.1 hypothetical protein [Oligoflexus sp.]